MPNPWDDDQIVQPVQKENPWNDDVVLKKKGSSGSAEPSTNDSKTPSPLLGKSGESKSFTERIATNELPQTFAKQQTKQKSDTEILAEKKASIPTAQEAQAKARLKAKEESKPLLDEIGEYAETVKTAIQKGWKQGELASKINEVASAQANAKMAKDFDFTPESYQKVYDGKVKQLGDIQKSIESVQSSKSVKKYEEAKDNNEAWEAFKENPIDIITNLALSSAASLFSNTLNSKPDGGDPVLGNMLQVPAPTVPLLMAEKSYQLGMSSDVIGALQESGVDLKDAKSVKSAVEDEQKMAEIYSNAQKRNIPIAIVDAVTGSIASKVTKAIPKKAVGVAAGLGVEATGGAAGEAIGQLASGQKLDTKSILEEAAGEVGAGAPNVASSFINTKNGGVQVQEPTQQSATNTEGAKPSAFATKQQESDGKPVSTEDNKGATIESAIIEIGGQTFEGKNHAEAILKAQQAGKDISKVDRQGEGMFKLSDGSVISREQAKETFGADKAEMLITQDENANEANKEYEKVKLEFKREDIANKIAYEDAKVIADIPLEDVPLLVKERTKTEDVSITPPIQASTPPVIQQPTITGTQEQEGTTRVQAVSENVQDAGTPNAKGVPVGEERPESDTKDVSVILKEMGDKQVPAGKGSWRNEFNNEKDPFRKSSILRAIADISTDANELSDIRQAAKGMPEESNITNAVELKEESIKKTPTREQQNTALKDVESTTKALEEIDREQLPLARNIADKIVKEYEDANKEIERLNAEKNNLSKQDKSDIIKKTKYKKSEKYPDKYEYNTGASIIRKTEQQLIDDYYDNKIKKVRKDEPREGILNIYRKQDKEFSTPKNIAEAYHKAKSDGSNPELVKAVESLLGEQNKITNEPTKEQDVQASVLDQSRATDSDTEKGAKQIKDKSLLKKAYKGQSETQIKEAIAEYGLTYEVESQVEAKSIADGIISDIGLDNAIEAVNRFEIQGAPAAFVLARGLDYLQSEILKPNSTEQLESLIQQQAKLVDLLDVKGRTGGRFSAALNDIYRGGDFDFNFDLEAQKKQYKDTNNGELPKAVEDKMIQLDTELKEVSKKLKETEDKVRLLEDQNAVESIKADISKTTSKKQRKGKALIAEGLDDIAEALGITLMATGDKRASVVNGLAKIGKGMIEEGVATIENVSEKLKEFVSQKLKGKLDFDEYQEEVIASISLEPEIKTGAIKIKQSTIRKIVEDGANNIDDLVGQLMPIVKKEYPNATEREIRDAVTSYGKIVNPQRDEIDIKIGKMKRIGRLISALEDVKEKKRPLKSGVQREKIDAEERALAKTLREAMKELPMDLETQEKQLKTILESTKQRLRNQIEDLNREISTKEQIPKSAKAFRSDEEIADLKKQRDELKKQHDEIFKNDDYKERLRLDIAKRNAEKKIADFERRIKDRDLSVKRRKQVEADKELNKLKIKQLELKDEFVKLQYENELKNRTRRQKVIDGLFEAWGLTRALRATGEMSFILLQGGVYTMSHPLIAAKAFTAAMSHFGSETRADNWLRKLKTTEQYMIMKESKLGLVEPNAKLSVREEQFLGGWVNHIWDFGGYPLKLAGEKAYENWKKANPIKAIERAGTGYMNTLRVERFLQGEIMLQEQGKTILNSKEDYKDMADVINTFTGRATLGAFESVSKPLSAIFFSPRNWASTIKTATPYALYHFGKMTSKTESGKIAVSVAQKMAVRDFMTYVGTTAAIVSLAAVALNDDDDEKTGVEFDPTSSDFMKIKLGNTRVDPWGGKIQQIILLSRLMAQSMKKADGNSHVLGYGNTSSSGELLAKMATNKLAPSASILNKLLFADKKKVKGEYVLSVPFEGEYDATEQLAANLYPIYWDSIKETYAEQPKVLASFLSALAFMGMGVNTYEQKQKNKKLKD